MMTADITISTIMILILNLLARVSLFISTHSFKLIDGANIQIIFNVVAKIAKKKSANP